MARYASTGRHAAWFQSRIRKIWVERLSCRLRSSNNLYTINKNTGAATVVENLGFGGIMDLDFDSRGNLFALSDSLYKVDVTTGHGTLLTHLANTCLMGMAIDQQDHFLATDYCSNNSPLFTRSTCQTAL